MNGFFSKDGCFILIFQWGFFFFLWAYTTKTLAVIALVLMLLSLVGLGRLEDVRKGSASLWDYLGLILSAGYSAWLFLYVMVPAGGDVIFFGLIFLAFGFAAPLGAVTLLNSLLGGRRNEGGGYGRSVFWFIQRRDYDDYDEPEPYRERIEGRRNRRLPRR